MKQQFVDPGRAPVIGVSLALVGTYAAAFVFFPENPAPAGALFVPAVILTACILAVPAVRTLTGSPEATHAENFVAFGYVFWLLLDLLQGVYDLGEASNRGLQLALASIGVSAAAMWVGMMARPWRIPQWMVEGINRPLHTDTLTKAVPVCLVLGMFNYMYSVNFDIPEMFSYLGESRWAVPWGRGQLGGWESFRDQAPYFGYVLPSLTALLIARLGILHPRSVFAIACSLVMLAFLAQSGGRRLIGVTVGAALMVWVQTNPTRQVKNMVVVGVGLLALAWTAQFMLSIRSFGYQASLEGRGEQLDYFHIDDNFLRLAQIIDIVPARRDHVGSQQIVFTLVRPVPRVLWPGKPVSPGFDLPAEVGMKGLSLSSSIIGEWYLAYGWFAVIFGGWFHGRLAAAANSLREVGNRVGNPIVYSLAVMVLLAGMRSMQELVLMSYALVAWWAVNRFLLKPSPHSA